MKYSSTIFSFFIIFLYQFASSAADANADFLKDYDNKICKSEPTCNLTSNPVVDSTRLTLAKRDCMCDAECVEYGDCCKDSQYFGKAPTSDKKYFCPPVKGQNYYMVYTCASNYTDEKIKSKCAKARLPLDSNDIAVPIPVTNVAKRITYANAYCALCNHETEFEKWNTRFGCAEVPDDYFMKKAALVKSMQTTNGTTQKSDDKLKLNIHFNPTSILGGNKDATSGFNKEISLPTLGGFGKNLNKTLGSSTGFFGANIGKSKRQTNNKSNETSSQSESLNFYPYASKVNELLKIVKFNATVQELTANYEGKQLICRIDYTLPKSVGNNSVRKCVSELISECPNDKTNQCKSSFQVVVDSSSRKSYQNKECAVCNGVDPSVLTGCPFEERSAASGLFSSDGKGSGDNDACQNEALAAKFC